MKICWILVLLCCSVPAFAVRGDLEKATVQAMRKVPCILVQNTGSGVPPGFMNSDSVSDNQCIEYELRTAKVSYIIRPRRAVLLMLGSDVFITLANNELIVRSGNTVKEIRCAVIAMNLRSPEADKLDRLHPDPARCYAASGREIACPDAP